MRDVVIANPVINSPFDEPDRHFRFDDDGITEEIVPGRRVSSYFMPIARTKKKHQLAFDTEWTNDRLEENVLVNQIRGRLDLWRRSGYPAVTPTTRRLLEYWTEPDREKRLFFCQIEALETVIYLAEAASRYSDGWIANTLREANHASNPGLPRIALKMATGAGKTVVMAMLIAWQSLNKLNSPRDNRFTDAFLIVTPGITIRDRLRVLLPNDPDNYYRQRDILPSDMLEMLGQAKIVITNFHTFLRGSGYSEGTLFPWVVSDFSLIDAIEAGIVKVPRVPVSDNAMVGTSPTYRDLWSRSRDDLPKKGK